MRIATIHQMIIDHHAFEIHFKVIIRVQKLDPLELIVWLGVCRCARPSNVSRLIVASHLEISTVLSEAHSKLAFIDDALFVHYIVNWFKSIQVLARPLRA